MSLVSVPATSNHRRLKAFAVRSFPTICGSATIAKVIPEAEANLISDNKVPPSYLITPPESTSCDPGNDFLSYRGKTFKLPVSFAIRKFPKGCGPLAASIPKPSDEASIDIARKIPEEGIDERDVDKSNKMSFQIPDFGDGGRSFCRPEGYEAMVKVEEMQQKSNDVVKRIPEEGNCLGKISECSLVGKSLGGKDGEKKPNRKSYILPDFVKDGKFYRPEGSEGKKNIEKMDKELSDVVRRTSEEGSGLGKVFKNAAVGTSGGKDGEMPNRKSSLTPDLVKDGRRFFRAERSESKNKVEDMKEKLNNVGRNSKKGDGSGKNLVSHEVGRSLAVKDGKKPDRKRSLMPDLEENGRSEGGQLLEVRGDRLIVLALMAARRCPWMQAKGKGSIGLQSRQKKPRIRAKG